MKPSHFEKLLPTEKFFSLTVICLLMLAAYVLMVFVDFFLSCRYAVVAFHFFLKLVFVVFPAIRSKALDNTSDWDLLS